MSRNGRPLNLEELGTGEARKRIEGGADTVLVPIGSLERHGNPFTPLGLDGIIVRELVERAARKTDVLHTPLMPFGWAPMHAGAPGEGSGAVTIRSETYRRLLDDIGRSLIFQGFNKVLFCTLHGPNVDVCDDVLYGLRYETGAFVSMYGGRESSAVGEIFESPPARLTSDIECSMAMALVGGFESEEYLARPTTSPSPVSSPTASRRPREWAPPLRSRMRPTFTSASTTASTRGARSRPAPVGGEPRARREALGFPLRPPRQLRPRRQRDGDRSPSPRLAPAGALRDARLKVGFYVTGSATCGYRELLDQVERADVAGFDSVWLRERHFHTDHQGRNFFSSPMLAAAWIAARTGRVRIGLGARILPLDHPLHIAEDAATVDLISGGRLDLGIARIGENELYQSAFGRDPAEARARFGEALELIELAWSGEPFTYQGEHYTVPKSPSSPVPPSAPDRRSHLVGISDATLGFGAERGFPLLLAGAQPEDEVGRTIAGYRERLDLAGHDPVDVAMPLNRFIYVAETTERARAEMGPAVTDFLNRPASVIQDFLGPRAADRRRRCSSTRSSSAATPSTAPSGSTRLRAAHRSRRGAVHLQLLHDAARTLPGLDGALHRRCAPAAARPGGGLSNADRHLHHGHPRRRLRRDPRPGRSLRGARLRHRCAGRAPFPPRTAALPLPARRRRGDRRPHRADPDRHRRTDPLARSPDPPRRGHGHPRRPQRGPPRLRGHPGEPGRGGARSLLLAARRVSGPLPRGAGDPRPGLDRGLLQLRGRALQHSRGLGLPEAHSSAHTLRSMSSRSRPSGSRLLPGRESTPTSARSEPRPSWPRPRTPTGRALPRPATTRPSGRFR